MGIFLTVACLSSRRIPTQTMMRTFVYGMRRLSYTISTTNRKKIRSLDLLVVAGGGQHRQFLRPVLRSIRRGRTDAAFCRNGVSQRRRLLLPFGIT